MNRIIYISMIIVLLNSFTVNAASKEPEVDAQGAILMDYKTGRVLWEKNAHTPLAMASTTKIMTAIMALEKGNLSDTVKVSRSASLAPPVKMHLKPGEEINLEYLLYALMLQSSNDAAVAIAEHISGSSDEFCKAMTEKARALGATDTVFETPNGLDTDNHCSTAYDMALITRYALANEEFNRIINTRHICVKSNNTTYDISNKNRLLSEFDGANGVKTGYTGKAGHCFVGAATVDDMQIISVVLASGWGAKGREQKWIDTKRILKYGFENYEYKDIVAKDQTAGNVPVNKSRDKNVEIYFEEGLRLPVKEGEDIFIKISKPETIEAPIKEGALLGHARIYLEGGLEREIDLLAKNDVLRHDFNTSLEKIINMAVYFD